jgi:lysyl-tRNA synthetase class 2
MLEACQAFTDYEGMMELVEHLVTSAARDALGTTVVEVKGQEVDLAEPWRRVRMTDLITEHLGVDLHPGMPRDEAVAIVEKLGLEAGDSWGAGRCTHHVYDELVEHRLVHPTFVLDHPAEVSPLAKSSAEDPEVVERFELIIGGSELSNAYSELNDPIDQRRRFEQEQSKHTAGDAEAGTVDEDYLRALEFGLPPTGGMGIGIDRLVMLLAGATSIREVVLFPTLRPEDFSSGGSTEDDG